MSANDIAIIGAAGRFPGAADVESFWRNLCGGVESVRRYSDEELLAAGLTREEIAHPRFAPFGAALEGADLFDADFFNFIPRHAELLDPQQRLLLECAWELMEGAGYDAESYAGAVGVYLSVARSGYRQAAARSPLERFLAYTSEDKDYAAARVSYKLNLRGPSLMVQTASSSSLVAVHVACESLHHGECDIAIAGGACVTFPQVGYLYDEALMLSPDGRCRAFDAEASGAVAGNGVGLVALKLLAQAQEDGDPILAVIKGSAVNNDGSGKVDFYAPSVEGQARVIEEALAVAGVSADTVGYVEAHGTGTRLGDPIEVEALAQAFARAGAARDGRCALGSLKTNVGHLHTAAGVAGLIKAALMLKHRTLVPSLNYRRPNAHIDFEATPFYVNTELRAWRPSAGTPLRAGVSAFGFGGTNAHV
ncbi:MAG TPA: polyketide synthase, partial [Pyrinomonadaceae bacterium]